MNLSFIFKIGSQIGETIIPYKVRFTSSINNQTSTLIIRFYTPFDLLISNDNIELHKQMELLLVVEKQLLIRTNDIQLIWVNGKPLITQGIFFITCQKESIKLKEIFKNWYSFKNGN